jgi:hypothetical protein
VEEFDSLPALLTAALDPSTSPALTNTLFDTSLLAARVASCVSIAGRQFVQVQVALVPALPRQPCRLYLTGISQGGTAKVSCRMPLQLGIRTFHV